MHHLDAVAEIYIIVLQAISPFFLLQQYFKSVDNFTHKRNRIANLCKDKGFQSNIGKDLFILGFQEA